MRPSLGSIPPQNGTTAPFYSGVTAQSATTQFFASFHYDERGRLDYVDISVESIALWMEFLLLGAVNDYLWYSPGELNHENARVWLYVEEEEDVTSLNMVCKVLGLNKHRLRYLLQDHKDQGKRRFYHLEYGDFLRLCK